MLEELLKEYQGAPLVLKPNALKATVTQLNPNETNAEIFNKILAACKEEIPYQISRTKSGGISYRVNKLRFPCYDYRISKSIAELTILGPNYKMYRIQFRNLTSEEDTNKISGHKAFLKLKAHLKRFNINLDNYNIENGKDFKSKIEKYMIALEAMPHLTYTNVHHIDFHSSFPSGLVYHYPEFYDAIHDLYVRRKTNKECKAILNYAIGYFHSPYNKYRLTHLACAAINDNNRRIRELKSKLKQNGNIILAINTDGIWYAGDIYHGEGEGSDLCQWANDHVNCTWRAKSKGAYEYIENDKYTPVVRGYTNLDKTKDRSKWQWGDIFREDAEIIKFKITENGIEYTQEGIENETH